MDAASQYDRAQISTRGFDPCHHEQQRLNFGHSRLRSPPGDSQMARLEGVEETSVMAHLSGAPVSGSRLLLCESAYPLEQLLLDLVGHRPCARARRHTECSVPAVLDGVPWRGSRGSGSLDAVRGQGCTSPSRDDLLRQLLDRHGCIALATNELCESIGRSASTRDSDMRGGCSSVRTQRTHP